METPTHVSMQMLVIRASLSAMLDHQYERLGCV